MKKTITMFSLLVGFALVSCAQESESKTPTAVEDAFKAKFPSAKSVKWAKENATEWEVEFKMNGVNYSANFSNEGTWKETEHAVKIGTLPEPIKTALSELFSGYKVEEAEMVETPDFSGYEVEIEKGEQSLEVVFDNAGKVLKKKIKQEEEEDNDEKED